MTSSELESIKKLDKEIEQLGIISSKITDYNQDCPKDDEIELTRIDFLHERKKEEFRTI